MTTSTRQHLNDYSKAQKELYLMQVAIDTLEQVDGVASVITALKKKQQSRLHRMDAAASKLGAPYPG